jgi:transcriptional regulator with XRE-family HTH domain
MAPEASAPVLGQNLKRLRQQRDWNLSRLAAEAGLPQSTMSKVESGQMSLNFDKLWLVARALEVDIGSLFAAPGDAQADAPTGRRTIDRRSEKFGTDGHYRFQFLSKELKNRLMMPLLLKVGELRPGKAGRALPMMNLVGERFAYVLEGPVEFHCAHYETVMLQAGDAIYVDAAMPHAFVAPPGTRGKVLTVLTSTDREYLKLCSEGALEDVTDVSNRYRERVARQHPSA